MSTTSDRLRGIRVRPVRVSTVTEGGMTLPSTGPLQTFGSNERSRAYVTQCRRSGAVNICAEETAVVIAAGLSKRSWSVELSSSGESLSAATDGMAPGRFCGLLGQFQTGKN